MEGLTSIRSRFGPKETMDRLEAAIRAHGMTVFDRINNAAGAVEAGLTLAPTELIIFGNARGGTPLLPSLLPTVPLRSPEANTSSTAETSRRSEEVERIL